MFFFWEEYFSDKIKSGKIFSKKVIFKIRECILIPFLLFQFIQSYLNQKFFFKYWLKNEVFGNWKIKWLILSKIMKKLTNSFFKWNKNGKKLWKFIKNYKTIKKLK